MVTASQKPRAQPKPKKQVRRIRFGVLKGKLRYPDDFDAPLPARLLALFEGRSAK